jgi:hypothetical protein
MIPCSGQWLGLNPQAEDCRYAGKSDDSPAEGSTGIGSLIAIYGEHQGPGLERLETVPARRFFQPSKASQAELLRIMMANTEGLRLRRLRHRSLECTPASLSAGK